MEIDRHHFSKIDSTNDWAKRHITEFKRDKLTVVIADEQSAGRGRTGRKWISPPGENIYATFCVFFDWGRKDLGNLSQLMAISASEVIQFMGFKINLKWPNDLLLNGKKVGGVLSEVIQVEEKSCLVCGLGLNVNGRPEVDQPATSLFLEGKRVYDRTMILEQLTELFAKNIQRFLKDGFSPYISIFRELLIHKRGQTIRFRDQNQHWEGTFESVEEDGSLVLRLDSGQIKRFFAGEIIECGGMSNS